VPTATLAQRGVARRSLGADLPADALIAAILQRGKGGSW